MHNYLFLNSNTLPEPLSAEKIQATESLTLWKTNGRYDDQILVLREACKKQEISFLLLQDLQVPDLVFFDMDSTLVGQESIVELARFAGKSEEVFVVTERAMAGELEFNEALRQRVACLQNQPDSIISGALNALHLNPGIENLLNAIKAKGGKSFLVSGGFHELADELIKRDQLKIDETLSNRLEVQDGFLTGKVYGPIIDGKAKADFVLRKRTEFEEGKNRAPIIWAVGDGANDIEMFGKSSAGIGYHCKPLVIDHSSGVNLTGSHQFLVQILALISSAEG